MDRVYWFGRVEELRKIYAERQQHLNSINQKREFDLKVEDMKAKIEELGKKIKESKKTKVDSNNYDVIAGAGLSK